MDQEQAWAVVLSVALLAFAIGMLVFTLILTLKNI